MAEEDDLDDKNEDDEKIEKEVEKEEKPESLQIKPTETKPPRNIKLILAIAGGVVVVLILVSVAVWFWLTSEDTQSVIRGTEEEAEFVEQYNRRMQTSLQPAEVPIYSMPFSSTVNLKNGYNYIHVAIRAVLYDPAALAFLEARVPLIDELIIDLLKNKLPQDIRTRTGLDTLKLELMTEFNKLFTQEFIELSKSKDRMPVKDILFVEYFIQ